MSHPETPVTVETHQQLQCPRCDGEPYLQAQLPATAGQPATTVLLCPHCDAHTPAAQPLLTWFTVHPHIDDNTVEHFAELLRRWLQDITPPVLLDKTINEAMSHWASPT